MAGKGRGTALSPIEYVFPRGFRYKSYALKTSELHPEAKATRRHAFDFDASCFSRKARVPSSACFVHSSRVRVPSPH